MNGITETSRRVAHFLTNNAFAPNLAVTLNSAPHHASNRQANTLQSGTLSRS
jgi:hypothetical protein